MSLWYLGIAMGLAGPVTGVPSLANVGAVFGLGLIVWFLSGGRTLIGTDQVVA